MNAYLLWEGRVWREGLGRCRLCTFLNAMAVLGVSLWCWFFGGVLKINRSERCTTTGGCLSKDGM